MEYSYQIYINSFNKIVDYNKNKDENQLYFDTFCTLSMITPNGLIYMVYNKEFDGFYYYSNNFINNKYIYLCVLHYVIKYKCRQLLLQAYMSTYLEDNFTKAILNKDAYYLSLLKEKRIKFITQFENIFKFIRVKQKDSIHNYIVIKEDKKEKQRKQKKIEK